MDGIHDMGGMHGFGPIEREENEPAFHEPWEGRVLGIARLLQARVPGGSRYQIESLEPAFYLASSYYEKWLHARINGLIEAGTLTEEEVAAKLASLGVHGRVRTDSKPGPAKELKPTLVVEAEEVVPAYEVGDRVRARHVHPDGHTRLPRYIRGREGEVVRLYRPQGFQDHEALTDHLDPQPVYAVRFDGREVWGASAEHNSSVTLDMWEAYLESA